MNQEKWKKNTWRVCNGDEPFNGPCSGSAQLEMWTEDLNFVIAIGIRSDLSLFYTLWREVRDVGDLANLDLPYPGYWPNTRENVAAATEYAEFETLKEAMDYAKGWTEVPNHLFPKRIDEPFCQPPSGNPGPWFELAEAAISQAGIDGNKKMVLMYLVGCTLGHDGICAPTMKALCEGAELSKPEVEKAIAGLRQLRMIQHEGFGFRRYYRVIDPALLAILNGEVSQEVPLES